MTRMERSIEKGLKTSDVETVQEPQGKPFLIEERA